MSCGGDTEASGGQLTPRPPARRVPGARAASHPNARHPWGQPRCSGAASAHAQKPLSPGRGRPSGQTEPWDITRFLVKPGRGATRARAGESARAPSKAVRALRAGPDACLRGLHFSQALQPLPPQSAHPDNGHSQDFNPLWTISQSVSVKSLAHETLREKTIVWTSSYGERDTQTLPTPKYPQSLLM